MVDFLIDLSNIERLAFTPSIIKLANSLSSQIVVPEHFAFAAS